jgi:hypothetical protein
VFSSYYPHFGKEKNQKKKLFPKSGWVSMDSPNNASSLSITAATTATTTAATATTTTAANNGHGDTPTDVNWDYELDEGNFFI